MITLSSTTDTAEQVGAALADDGPETTGVDSGATPKGKAETAAETETAETNEEEQETPGGKPPAQKSAIQRRIDKLFRQGKEWEARALAAEAELAKTQTPETPKPPTTESKAPAEKPTPEKFESYEDYLEALTDWKVEQKALKLAEEQRANQAQTAHDQLVETWKGKLAKAPEKYADFAEVTDQELPITAAMQAVMLDSEVGIDIAYYLGQNPEECERIATLSPLAQARAIGKIEAQFGKEVAPPTDNKPKPAVATLPKPIRPVHTGATASTKDPEKMSPAEYRRWRESGGGK